MRKLITILVIALFVIVGFGFGLSRLMAVNNAKSESATATMPATVAPTQPATPIATLPVSEDIKDYKTITIRVDGEEVNLVEGSAEMPAAPDSKEMIAFTYFGNEAHGDLDGDGTEDTAFLLTRSGAGSGVFFYAVAALNIDNGYIGTNAVLLGDRIAPQSTVIEDNLLIVNYADRLPTEPFTVPPSIGISKYLKITDGSLVEANSLAQITIQVDGQEVNLVNGSAKMPAAPGSNEMVTYTYFGNEAHGDLDGNGSEDIVFLLTQSGAGSGTFFYVAAALNIDNGYVGTNAVLLGDRIAPQSTTIEDEMAVVNYQDRLPSEPFTTPPSVGISKYLKIKDGNLMEVNVLSQISNREWKWVKTEMNDDTITIPQNPDAFTITFHEDGSLSGTTDCNNFMGQFTIKDNELTLHPIGATLKACPNSQESVFLTALGEVNQFMVNPLENTLVLLIKFDSGSIIFQ